MTSTMTRWDNHKEQKYLRIKRKNESKYESFRNTDGRRRLVVAHYVVIIGLGLSTTPVLLGFLESAFRWGFIPWIVFTALMCVTRNAIHAVSDYVTWAPAHLLDEYQYERVQDLRSLGYRMLDIAGTVILLGLCFVGGVIAVIDPSWARYVPYAIGILGLVVWVSIESFPASAYAWTMTDD